MKPDMIAYTVLIFLGISSCCEAFLFVLDGTIDMFIIRFFVGILSIVGVIVLGYFGTLSFSFIFD